MGSLPFEMPDMPTPATTIPPAPPPPTGSLPPPPPTAGLLASSPGAFSGSVSAPAPGTPQIGLEMLRNEHISLKSKLDAAKDWAGYVYVSHNDIMRYIELTIILNAATSSNALNPAQPEAVPSHLTASLDTEKLRLGELEKSLRQREEKILELEKKKAPLEKQLAEAKASLESIEESLKLRREEFAALRPREADLVKRELEVEEKKAALDEREELLKAGEDGLEAQEEENMAYAAQLMEEMKVAKAALEKEKELDAEKAAIQQQKEEVEKKVRMMKLVDKDLQKKDEALAKREADLAEKENRAVQEAKEIEKVKAFLKATAAGQQTQYQGFEKKRAAFIRQYNYQALPTQPPVLPVQPPAQQALLVQPPRQPVLQLRPPQQQQTALTQAHQQPALSLPHPARQILPDTNQRVVLGYQYGWEAALPVGVEKGRRKATAETTKLHVKNLQKVIAKIRELMSGHNQYMAGAIKIDLNQLQKDIGELIDQERDHAEDVEMSFDETADATLQKDDNAVTKYIRSMSIETGCPIYYYWPANPSSGAPIAGIIRPAPPNSTPESLGVSPVTVLDTGNNPPPVHNNQWQLPSSRASTLAPVPGPDVPTIQITTPGSTDLTPASTLSPACRRGGGVVSMMVRPAALSRILQVPPRNYKRKERERSNSPAPGGDNAGEPAPKKKSWGRPRKNRSPAPSPAAQVLASATPENTASAVNTSVFAPVPAPASQGNPPVGGPPSQEEVDKDGEMEGDEDKRMMGLADVWGWMAPLAEFA